MKVIYTYEALRDLDEILTFIASNYPNISAAFQERLQSVERCIGMWPMSAQEVTQAPRRPLAARKPHHQRRLPRSGAPRAA